MSGELANRSDRLRALAEGRPIAERILLRAAAHQIERLTKDLYAAGKGWVRAIESMTNAEFRQRAAQARVAKLERQAEDNEADIRRLTRERDEARAASEAGISWRYYDLYLIVTENPTHD